MKAMLRSRCAFSITLAAPANRSRMPSSNPFLGGLRDECLNETLFTSLAHARATLTAWKDDYNMVRPHSGLGNLAPSMFARALESLLVRAQ
jgi:putative transposase